MQDGTSVFKMSQSVSIGIFYEIYKFSVRINGIDTPEMKAHEDHEKNVAKLA